MKKNPSSTTVLVTGGAKGIGLATVELLLQKGYRVIAWDMDVTGLDLREKINPG